MRNRWALAIASPLVCAALTTGCGGSDREEPRPQQPISNAAEPAKPAEALVSLTGCVELAPGTEQYRLQHVRFEPRGTGDPQRDTGTSQPKGITEGAWVRLRGEGTDLRSYAGQRVTISGAIVDTGANTIGTAGTPGVATPSGDSSQAASREGHSDKVKTEAGRIA